MTRSCHCAALIALVVGLYQAVGEQPVITAFDHNGRLDWSHSATSGHFTVLWASTPTGEWRRSWSPLEFVAASGTQYHANVPMFYRVVHTHFSLADLLVTNILVATGDNVSTVFSGQFVERPVLPGTLSLLVGQTAFVDDGQGHLQDVVGSGFGQISYSGGNWSIDLLGRPLSDEETVRASFLYGPGLPTYPPGQRLVEQEVLASGNGVATRFSGFFAHAPLVADSVVMQVGSATLFDDADGALTGPGGARGRIVYATGFWFVYGAEAIAETNSISADYTYYN